MTTNQQRTFLGLIACLISLQSSGQANATTEPDSTLRGQAFTDPDFVVGMPEKWRKQHITYDKAVKQADLVVSFGQQTYPALKGIIAEYARKNNLKILVQSGTCGISAGKLLHKTIDAGVFCCPPGKNDRLPNLEFHTIAISPLAVIVHKDNPVDNISIDEARLIFRGKIRNWSEVDNNNNFNKRIVSLGRLHCKKRPGHWTLLLKDQTLFGPKLKEVGVIPDLVSKVGMQVNTISMETPFMVETYSKQQNVKLLKINNHSVTDIDYVASGQYPLYRTYSITTWKNFPEKRKLTLSLIQNLKQHIEDNYSKYNFVPVSKLKEAGWKFRKDELIGEPNRDGLAQPR